MEGQKNVFIPLKLPRGADHFPQADISVLIGVDEWVGNLASIEGHQLREVGISRLAEVIMILHSQS
jgi:hypothetical protein